jgi:hypothetical protein
LKAAGGPGARHPSEREPEYEHCLKVQEQGSTPQEDNTEHWAGQGSTPYQADSVQVQNGSFSMEAQWVDKRALGGDPGDRLTTVSDRDAVTLTSVPVPLWLSPTCPPLPVTTQQT